MKSIELTEKQFESQVKDLAKLYGWKYYHTWRSIHSPAGFPDCVMVRGGQLIFAELKSEKGKMSNDQLLWYLALKLVTGSSHGCVFAYVWRPSDFDSIVGILG